MDLLSTRIATYYTHFSAMLTAQLAAQLLSSAFVFSLRLSWLGYILGCPSPHSFFSYLILRACPPCYFFHCFSVPVRAYPTSQPFSSVVEPDTCTSSDFETSPRLFFILGHIREFLSLLSLFCRGAASLLQDVYQNIPTIKL